MTITVDEQLHEGTTALDPRHLAFGHRQPLHLDLARAQLRARSSPTARRSRRADRRRRSTSTSSSTPSTRRPARACRTSSRARRPSTPATTRRRAQTYKYFAPSLQASERLFAELNPRPAGAERVPRRRLEGLRRARRAQRRPRRPDLEREPGVRRDRGRERGADRGSSRCRRRMRQANTTFVNLRAALDDLDPLIADTKVVTPELAPFLRQLRPVVERLGSGLQDLAARSTRPARPTISATRCALPPGAAAAGAQRRCRRRSTALADSQHLIDFARPYSPDLLAVHRQARRRRRLLRLQRPLPARSAGRRQPLRLQRGHRRPRARSRWRSSTTPSSPRLRPAAALPGRRDAAERRLAEPDRPPVPRRRRARRRLRPRRRTAWPMRRVLGISARARRRGGAARLGGRRRRRRRHTRSARSSTTPASSSTGEDVRIAGAKVGSVAEVDITDADEVAHAKTASPRPARRSWSCRSTTPPSRTSARTPPA